MARTRDGRDLTEAHRLQQIQVAEEARQEAAFLFALHGIETPGDRASLLASMMLMLRSRWSQSQSLASIYLREFRLAEVGTSFGRIIELGFPDARYGAKFDALVTPPLSLDPDDLAWMQKVEREILAEAGRAAMAGGRSTLDRSARAQRVRYRRVTDGKPCAFCAMLASRGPVYSQETAYFRAHGHCGCTAEEVYGRWTPTSLEREWVTSYYDAADAARKAGESVTEDSVLWRMRRNSPGLFSDGIAPKADAA